MEEQAFTQGSPHSHRASLCSRGHAERYWPDPKSLSTGTAQQDAASSGQNTTLVEINILKWAPTPQKTNKQTRGLLSNRAFCGDENVLYLSSNKANTSHTWLLSTKMWLL